MGMGLLFAVDRGAVWGGWMRLWLSSKAMWWLSEKAMWAVVLSLPFLSVSGLAAGIFAFAT